MLVTRRHVVERVSKEVMTMPETTQYTSGELARECGTTVRTVQYYDSKGLLAPSALTDGGRRLYTQDDADKLRFILMLKSLGLGLAQIKGALDSPNRVTILITLLKEQANQLETEVHAKESQLAAIRQLTSDIELFGRIKTTTEAGMVARMEDRKAWKRWVAVMLTVGILMDIAWIGTLVLGILKGIWWPFPLALVAVALAGAWLVFHYDAHVTYMCPACGADFRPKVGPFFVSRHTPKTRLLVCPCCGAKDWCVEHYHADELDIAPGTCLPGTCEYTSDQDENHKAGDVR